jgi:hypothetical protein
MDLRDFVSETLIQIADGVKQAQEKATEIGARVNPKLTGGATHAAQHGFLAASGAPAQIVQFDVALTVKEGSGTKGGIGIFAGAVTLGSSGQSNAENSSVSRVKFSVPLSFPESN